ncbi:MAG: ComF family protein [Bacteroidales bacterium]
MLKLLKSILGLFFPRLCLACGKSLFDHEEFICNPCWMALPRTNYHLEPENPVAGTFWGRVWLVDAAACFYYNRGNKVQRLIHQLKYKGEEELGEYLGEHYGSVLKQEDFLAGADLLIPVPLHPKKLKARGYNQSEAIARGLGSALGVRVETGQLYRVKSTSSQTRKSRYDRWENVDNIFQVHDPDQLQNKYVVVIDDVITTGSTLEACVDALQRIPGIRISVVALAYAAR